jgi:protocatechuate 3,4-dioxygenase beta subunit
VLSRREVLRLLGAGVAASLAGVNAGQVLALPSYAGEFAAAPACVVVPEQTEGPFFVDERLNRSDLRVDPADGSLTRGLPFELAIRVSSFERGACTALPGVMVDVWHCDALGHYSDEAANGTAGKKFLRGYQITDSNGTVRFTTIYPGWYPGRTVHIHFKLRPASPDAKNYDFTSQLYFDDPISDAVFSGEPYAARGPRAVKNSDDRIYRRGGDQLLLSLAKSGAGYKGTFDIGLQLA